MKYTPRNYQLVGAEFLKARRFAMLGDACGVGKTGQAIISLDPSWSVLIVCPASVKLQWQTALKDWRDWGSTIIDTAKWKGLVSNRAFTAIVNYDLIYREPLLSSALMKWDWDLIIFDEAHKLKSLTSKRTKAALSMKGLRSRAKRVWFLTGTPVKNRPVDLYAILRSCAPEVLGPYSSYLKFCYRYCGAYYGKFGMDVSGASHIEELGDRLKTFMLRREKRDVLTELPPRIISKVELDCTPAVREIIEAEEQATIEQAGARDPALFKLGEQVRIRKALAKYKVAGAVEYIKDLLETEDKIVVFYHHKGVLSELRKHTAGLRSVFIDGGVPPQSRAGIVENFYTDAEVRIFFGQMEACGEGIDGLQRAASCCIFVEPSWSHTDLEQCIGRLERSGQTEPINVHILVIKETLESKMMDVVAMKLNTDKKLYGQQTKPKQGDETMAKKLTPTEKELVFLAALRDLLGESSTDSPKATEQAAARVQPKAEPEEVEVEPDIDISEESIRARANDCCTAAPGGKGKDAVVALVKSIGGGKIADLKTPELRVKAMAELDILFTKLAGK
jgi:SWI/SNF-related matrix-associated actin-dependent regulator of chromatin subfamily A-like protein 1